MFFAVAALGVHWVLTATDVADVTRERNGALAYKQTTQSLIGGCGPMYAFPDEQVARESGTVPDQDKMGQPNRQEYRSVVPMFGPFWSEPVPPGKSFWERTDTDVPAPERLLANMWNGAMVVYYTDDVSDEELDILRRVIERNPDLGVLAVPWNEKVRGWLPRFREIAFATWNGSQTCHQLIAPAVFDYREAHPADEAPGVTGRQPKVLSDTPPLSVPVGG